MGVGLVHLCCFFLFQFPGAGLVAALRRGKEMLFRRAPEKSGKGEGPALSL